VGVGYDQGEGEQERDACGDGESGEERLHQSFPRQARPALYFRCLYTRNALAKMALQQLASGVPPLEVQPRDSEEVERMKARIGELLAWLGLVGLA
jgi:hypothetical protein